MNLMRMPIRVGVFSTCLIRLMRPSIALATLELISQAGCKPLNPRAQTCCGQPALNAGRRDDAKSLALKCAREFATCDTVVAASGSCMGALKTHMPSLFASTEPGADEVADLADKCIELATFLVGCGFVPQQAAKPLKIAYHDSCAGLRELGIQDQPRALLKNAGHELVPLANATTCCGFGGTFALSFGELSGQLAEHKCACAAASQADVLAMGDLGCMLSIEGRMLRRAKGPRVVHFAELLAAPNTSD